MTDLITIASPALSATISTKGAEWQSLTDAAGRDLMWNGDGRWWTGRAPLLFPIVGALGGNRHVIDGTSYAMGKHGFVRERDFAVIARSTDSVTFRLEASPATRELYPWDFRLDVTFAVDGPTLTTTAEITNPGATTMPFSFGYHPAFLWPLPGAGDRSDQVVEFEADEASPASRIDREGLLVGEEAVNRVVNRQLKLDDVLFDDDALLYLSPVSRRVRFGHRDGTGTSLEVAFPDLPHLGIWTKPGGAPYLCIEPWQGYASPRGYDGSLMEKPGMIQLPPGESRRFVMSVTVTGDAGQGIIRPA